MLSNIYLLFHTAAELFSASVAFGVYFIAWNTRRYNDHGFFSWVGSAYLYVAILDLFHTLAYKGMGVFPDQNPDPPTQFWIAARVFEALALACSPLYARRPAPKWMHPVFAGTTMALIASILVLDVFPTCYVEGKGLTTFKVGTEYVVIALLSVATWAMRAEPKMFAARETRLLTAMFILKILSELMFTTYANVFDSANALGHVLKIAAFYLLYHVTIKGALSDPYNSLFGSLLSARDALEASENRFRMAIKPAPVAVFSQDAALRFTWLYNGGVMGMPPNALGKTDSDLFEGRDASTLARLKRQTLLTGVGQRRQLRLEGKDFDLIVEPVRGAHGLPTGIVGTAIDITPLTRARAEAEMANQSKSRFLAAASHDLRQPFQAMRLFHHLLASQLTSARHRSVSDKLAEAMDAGESLLNSLLDISTLEAGNIEPKLENFPLAGLVGRVVRELEPQVADKDIGLRWIECGAWVRSDQLLLTRMVRNLAVNAVRYTGQGGRILIGCRRAGPKLRIEVWDTGCGIPTDKLQSVFEDFYQIGNAERDRTKGLGLGLSIVARIGSLLDHPVSLCSREGRGSMFAITVPLSGQQLPAPAATPAQDVVSEGCGH